MEKRFFDVSMPIANGMISWPSHEPVRVERVRSMEEGERLNLSRLEMNAHTGTHVDAPVHFLRDGGGIDTVPLETLIGSAVLVHLPKVHEIGERHLASAGIERGCERLLIKTDNSTLLGKGKFDTEFAYLTPEGARYLVEHEVRLVGIDYLSVAQYGKGDEVHRELLGAGVVIIEGLDLRDVPPGPYHLTALPLRIPGSDGAPARVVLEEVERKK